VPHISHSCVTREFS